jgi:uncharacterized damage-inducible protein DinB
MQPQLTYDYLTKARARLFDWTRPLSKEQYDREFPYAMKTIHATLLHTAGAEWIYDQRLRGRPGTSGDSPFTAEKIPAFAGLESAWNALAGETRALLGQIADWDTPLEYRAFPQGPSAPAVRIKTTKGGVAAQMLFHEVHHRSPVMSMLKQLGVQAQNLDYSALMFTREQESA